MELRVFIEPQEGANYDDQLRVARQAEAAGYPAFFRSDHLLKTGPVDGRPGPTDAWVTLAGLARETSTIRLGTLMTAATFRWPGALAITVAQVDQMSGGRIELGLGAAWFADEHAANAVPFPGPGERVDRMEEQLEILTGLWAAEGPFSYSGRHYRIVDSPALPKPAQRPRPPLLLGGRGKVRTPAVAARFADEFNVSLEDMATCRAQFDRVAAACRAIGRDPAEVALSVAQTVCVGADDAEVARRAAAIDRTPEDLRATALAGTPGEVVDRIGEWGERTGVTRIYLQLLDLADLDHLDLIASDVMPQLR